MHLALVVCGALLRDFAAPLMRRGIDVSVALIGLALLLPFFAVAAVVIAASSPGPILFRERRVGEASRVFLLYKLRTMHVGADRLRVRLQSRPDALDGPRFKLRRDPRVTAVGRWLRRFSLDETPQLWNLLLGDMTLVGPRPASVHEVEAYDPHMLRRLEVRPGLTGLWQVSGRSDLPFRQQIELDIACVDRVGAIGELDILWRTPGAVLSGRGAY
jgi:lipopolysaccharide/colanic/teichoic acid biosynthesis glycosyltransferase